MLIINGKFKFNGGKYEGIFKLINETIDQDTRYILSNGEHLNGDLVTGIKYIITNEYAHQMELEMGSIKSEKKIYYSELGSISFGSTGDILNFEYLPEIDKIWITVLMGPNYENIRLSLNKNQIAYISSF